MSWTSGRTTGDGSGREGSFDSIPPPPELAEQKSKLVNGIVRSGQDLVAYCERKGLCPRCCDVRTHERKLWGMKPLNKKDDNGQYLIYKGYCIRPLCYSLDEAKRLLGEDVPVRTSSRSNKGRSRRRIEGPHSGRNASSPRMPSVSESAALTTEQSAEETTQSSREESMASSQLSGRSAETEEVITAEVSPVVARATVLTAEVQPALQVATAMPPRQEGPVVSPGSASARITRFGDDSESSQSSYQSQNHSETGSHPSPGEQRRDSGQSLLASIQSNTEAALAAAAAAGQPMSSPNLPGGPDLGMETAEQPRSRVNIPLAPNLEMDDEDVIAISELEKYGANSDYRSFIDSLSSHWDMPRVVERAFQLLRDGVHVAHEANNGQDLFESVPWVKIAVTAMENNSSNLSVQSEGVLMLWTLSAVRPAYMKDLCKESSFVDAILNIMAKHMMVEEIVERCCGALECISSNEKVGLNMRHKSTKKAISMLVKVIDGDIGFSKSLAIRALYNLSVQECGFDNGQTLGEQVLDALPDRQGVKAIMDMIDSDSTDVHLTECVIRLLWSFSAQSTSADNASSSTSVVVASEELIESLLATIKSFEESPTVQDAACGLLSNLVTQLPDEGSISTETTTTIAEAVLSSTRIHFDVPAIQVSAVHVIGSLCSDPERCGVVADMDVVSVVVEAMNSCRDDGEFQIVACTTLMYLCAHSDDCKQSIVSNGGIRAIAHAFRTHVVDNEWSLSSEAIDLLSDRACAALASLVTAHAATAVDASGLLLDFDTLLKNGQCETLTSSMRMVVINLLVLGSQSDFPDGRNYDSLANMAMYALKSAETEEETQILLGTINSMTCKHPDVLDAILLADGGGGMGLILQALEAYKDSASIQKNCAILANIYVKIPYNGELNQQFLLTKGALSRESSLHAETHTAREVEIILSAMKKHKDNAGLQQHACSALCNFIAGSYDPVVPCEVDAPETVVSVFSGALKLVVDAMSMHPVSVDVQTSAVRLFWVLSFLNDEMEMKRWSLHAITKVLEAMDAFRENQELHLDGCGVLMTLLDNEEARQFIGRCDGIRTLLLSSQLQNEEIVERATEILSTVLETVFTASNEFMQVEDSVDDIILCMNMHPESIPIQMQTCSLLRSVAALQDRYVKTMIAKHGGLVAILEVMRKFGDDEAAYFCACRALYSIVQGLTPRVVNTTRDDLARLLLNGLEAHSSEEVQEAVISTLHGLTYLDSETDPFFKEFITESNGIPLIIDAMAQHVFSEPIQECGCAIMWTLAPYRDCKTIIGRAGLRAIINGMLAHISAAAVQKNALTALKNLSTAVENKTAITNLGGIEAIVQSIWVNMNESMVLCAGCAALNNIAVDEDAKRVSPMERGELPAVVFGMKKHPDSEDVQKCACFLLKSYTFNPANIPMMKTEPELIPLLAAAAERFPEECNHRASYVIERI